MRIVFLGTPEIAKTCLEELYYNSKHEILAVITKMDKPVGRGNVLTETPVKTFAKSVGLPVFSFPNFKVDGVELIKKLKPDALVLVAFGVILPEEILNLALPLNLHGSLLPKYRGPSPIQTAILDGETETGVTIMKMANEVDAGDILAQEKVKITDTDTSATLFEKMAQTGAKLFVKTLDAVENGTAKFTPQDHSKATFTHILTKENAELDFDSKAKDIVNKIRAYNPNPIAYFMLDGKKLKVYSARIKKFDLNLDYDNEPVEFENKARFNFPNINIKIQDNSENIVNANIKNIELSLENVNNLLFNNIMKMQFPDIKVKLQNDMLNIYKNGEVVASNGKDGLVIKASDDFVEILEIQAPNGKILQAKQLLNGTKITIHFMLS